MRTLFFRLFLALCTITVAIPRAALGQEISGKRNSPARVTTMGGFNAKVFDSWNGEMALGDCQARKAKLTVYENGSLEWEVELMSTDTGDEWNQSFDFYDDPSPGQTSLGNRRGGRFEFKYSNSWRSWRWGGPSSPDPKLAEVFDRIRTVRWSASC